MGKDGVLGRIPNSEWQLVRHKRTPRYPKHRDDGRLATGKIIWNKVWNDDKRFVTFFFKNFPESSNVHSLSEIFRKIGQVRDVFIPNKKGRDGIRYGFVRFTH